MIASEHTLVIQRLVTERAAAKKRSPRLNPGSRGRESKVFCAIALALAAVKGWSILDAACFAVVTIATIGYSVLVPKTAAGKIFAIACVICGIGIYAAGALGEHIADRARPS